MNVTAGVIGCGNISRFHFSGLEKAGVKVKWVCDLSEEAARPWAEKLDARFTTDYREVIADPDVNLINVTAFSSTHKVVCLDAIQADKAVVCEKTLGVNTDDALEVVRLAEERQTIFYTCYMKRFIPAVEKAKELLPSVGRIVSSHVRAYQCWGNLWDTMPEDGIFHTPVGGMSDVRRRYGGGILVCGGSHILDLVMFLLGRPHKLYASMYTPDDRDYDLQAAALMETENGVVHYEALVHPLHKIGFLRDGWDERLEINGLNGRIEVYSALWDQVDTKGSLLIHYDNSTGKVTEYQYDPVSPFDRAIAFFCVNIERGEQGAQSRLTGYEVDELIAHIEKSASKGRAVSVNWRL